MPFQSILADIVVNFNISIIQYPFMMLFKTDIANLLQNRYGIGLLHCTICFQLWAWHGHKSYKIDCHMDTRPQTICCVFILYLPSIISCPVGGIGIAGAEKN